MSLFTIADLIRSKCCLEHRRYGTCRCKRNKGKYKGTNPCQWANSLADDCEAGENIEAVLKWLGNHRCRYPVCNHKSCACTDDMIRYLTERRKAA